MYIPRERLITENSIFTSPHDPLQSQLQRDPYYLGPRSAANATSNEVPVNVSSAFVAVTVAALALIAFAFAFGIYKKCSCNPDDSDNESSITESAWRVDDPESANDVVAAKHRKRLKKLDQVAPVQSLHDWRAEKLLTHVETFATLSTKLVCAICLDLIEEKESIRELQCGHVYHSDCLNLWVERGHHDCPLCKYDILGLHREPPESEEGEAAESQQRRPSPEPERSHIVVISNVQPGSETNEAHGALSGSDARNG